MCSIYSCGSLREEIKNTLKTCSLDINTALAFSTIYFTFYFKFTTIFSNQLSENIQLHFI